MQTSGIAAFSISLTTAAMLMASATAANAQQELVGTYKGEYKEAQYPFAKVQLVTFTIATVQDGKVTGKYELESFDCRGVYDIQGTILDNRLELRTGEGPVKGCGDQRLSLSVEGNKLVGRTSMEAQNNPGITLSKR